MLKHFVVLPARTTHLFLLKHPGFDQIDARLPFDEYPNANNIMQNAFVIGAHQSLEDDDINYLTDTFAEFFEQQQ